MGLGTGGPRQPRVGLGIRLPRLRGPACGRALCLWLAVPGPVAQSKAQCSILCAQVWEGHGQAAGSPENLQEKPPRQAARPLSHSFVLRAVAFGPQ